jgi:hypothetical protein
MSIPAIWRSSSPEMCCEVPGPGRAHARLGYALNGIRARWGIRGHVLCHHARSYGRNWVMAV